MSRFEHPEGEGRRPAAVPGAGAQARRRWWLGMLLVATAPPLLLAGGCAASPPLRWLVLPAEPPGAAWPAPTPPAIAPASGEAPAAPEVWELAAPLRLPEALDRDAVLVADGVAGLRALPGLRWAEPLRDALPRLLRHDLQRLRGDDRVWAAPAPAGVVPTRRLELELLVLQADAGGRLQLSARWWLQDLPAAGRPAGPPRLGRLALALPLTAAGSAAGSGAGSAAGSGAGAAPAALADAVAVAHRLAVWRLAQAIAATPADGPPGPAPTRP